METRILETQSLPAVVALPDDYDPAREYPLALLLHGFGANMYDLAGLAPAISRSDCLFVCPNAPLALNIGDDQVGYGWANHYQRDVASYEKESGESEALLEEFFAEMERRVRFDRKRLFLGGFSQGGMMTYRFGLPRPERFAGLFALSGFFVDPEALERRLPARRDQRLFVAHGFHDEVVPLIEGRASNERLIEWGYAPEYREYPMGHEISTEALDDLASWLAAALAA